MPRCPRDYSQMKPLGISWVCPRCDYKMIRREKSWEDSLRFRVYFPREYAWDTFTTTNIDVSGNTASITTGETEGTLISPQITNLTQPTGRERNIYQAKIEEVTAIKNGGRLRFYVSNDGGVKWTPIKDNGHRWSLNYGNEGVFGTIQTTYDDLRLKVVIQRDNASDTSPTIDYLHLSHDYMPDRKKRRVIPGTFRRRRA